jgi:hypothetical protein
MNGILQKALQALLTVALAFLTKDQLKQFADMAFDFVEKAVQDSSNTIDDALVLPVIQRLREAFDIPDLPDA